jgi:hypothetical protein
VTLGGLKNILTKLRKKDLIYDRLVNGKRRLFCRLSLHTKSVSRSGVVIGSDHHKSSKNDVSSGHRRMTGPSSQDDPYILEIDTSSKDAVSGNFTKVKSPSLPSESLRDSSCHAECYGMASFMVEKKRQPNRKNTMLDDFGIKTPKAMKPKQKVRQVDVDRARRFLSIVYKHGILSKMRRIRPDTWARTMLQAAQVRGEEYLDRVIDYMDRHGNVQYCPKPRTALQLLERIKIGQFDTHFATEERENPKIPITDDAKRIVKRLENNLWPGNVVTKLPVAVQVSLNNYTEWVRLLRVVKLNDRQRKIVDHLLFEFHESQEFVAQWFEAVFDRVCEWDEWHANILREVIDPFDISKETRFTKMCLRVCNQYTLNGTQQWKEIQEVVNRANRRA